MRNRRGRRRRGVSFFSVFTADNFKKITAIISSILIVGLLLFMLGSEVVKSNEGKCHSVGLEPGLLGCNTDEEYSYDYVYLVVGNTANSPAPKLSNTVKKYLANSMVSKNYDIRAYSATYNMDILFSEKGKKSDSTLGIDPNEIEKSVTKKIDEINDKISSTEPTTDGARYLETIENKAKALKTEVENNKGTKGIIIVIGSGLSDGGVLNFSEGRILEKEASITTSRLDNSGVVSDNIIAGKVDIAWSCIGIVASPQAKLSDPDTKKMETIYTHIFEKMGFKKYSFPNDQPDDMAIDSIKTKYKVKIIKVRDPNLWGDSGVIFDEESDLAFKSWGDSFLDSNRAKKELDYISDQYKQFNGVIKIEGYTAADKNRNVHIDIAEKRVERIRKELIARGVKNSDIEADAIGKGSHEEFCKLDNPDEYCEDEAKKNRIVVIKMEEKA